MKRIGSYYIVQNLGAVDRIVRVIVGIVILGIPFAILSQPGAEMTWWFTGSMMLGIYPFLTAIVGVDPLYHLFKIRSCTVDPHGRNQCGSFPYEVDALLGHEPKPRHSNTHDLSDSDHMKKTA
jgi:hypothetical protein